MRQSNHREEGAHGAGRPAPEAGRSTRSAWNHTGTGNLAVQSEVRPIASGSTPAFPGISPALAPLASSGVGALYTGERSYEVNQSRSLAAIRTLRSPPRQSSPLNRDQSPARQLVVNNLPTTYRRSAARGGQQELKTEQTKTHNASQDGVQQPNASLRLAVAQNRTLIDQNNHLRSELQFAREDIEAEIERCKKDYDEKVVLAEDTLRTKFEREALKKEREAFEKEALGNRPLIEEKLRTKYELEALKKELSGKLLF